MSYVKNKTSSWKIATVSTGSFVNNVTYHTIYRQEGDSLRVRTRINFTGDPGSVGNCTLNLPDDYSIDVSKLPQESNNCFTIGTCWVEDAGNDSFTGNIALSSGAITLFTGSQARAVTNTTPAAARANGDIIFAEYLIPVIGV